MLPSQLTVRGGPNMEARIARFPRKGLTRIHTSTHEHTLETRNTRGHHETAMAAISESSAAQQMKQQAPQVIELIRCSHSNCAVNFPFPNVGKGWRGSTGNGNATFKPL